MPFKSVNDITLGARYKDVVTGVEGIAVSKTECLTGCDRVTLQQQDKDARVLSTDVSTVEFIDKGVSERFAEIAEDETIKPGGPAVVSSSLS